MKQWANNTPGFINATGFAKKTKGASWAAQDGTTTGTATTGISPNCLSTPFPNAPLVISPATATSTAPVASTSAAPAIPPQSPGSGSRHHHHHHWGADMATDLGNTMDAFMNTGTSGDNNSVMQMPSPTCITPVATVGTPGNIIAVPSCTSMPGTTSTASVAPPAPAVAHVKPQRKSFFEWLFGK